MSGVNPSQTSAEKKTSHLSRSGKSAHTDTAPPASPPQVRATAAARTACSLHHVLAASQAAARCMTIRAITQGKSNQRNALA